MAFRIETTTHGTVTMVILSGRVDQRAIAELERLFERHADRNDIVLDLKDVSVVDREVVSFFVRCEADGVRLENCASYIRGWMDRDND
jgi:anti-anti-sigma regulatory factor